MDFIEYRRQKEVPMDSKTGYPHGKIKKTAPAGRLSWLEHHPLHQKVAGLIPGQGTYLGFGFNSQMRHIWEATD